MPNKTIYIRREDEELWEKLPKKAEAISKMLRGQNLEEVMIVEVPTSKELQDKKLEELMKGMPQPKIYPDPRKNCVGREVVLDDPDWDKKYSDGELPCCKNTRKMCSHWVWVEGSSQWMNNLSGKKIEVE